MGFIPLDEFKTPPLPAQEWLRRVVGRLETLTGRGGKPFIAADQLKRATMDTLDQVVAPPACATVIDELDQTVAEWLAAEPRTGTIKLIVLPPCDENAIVATWAEAAGHQILPSPARDTLLETPALQALPELGGEGLLVLPRLEDWFLRHRNGLRVLRALLAALDASGRLAVVGCNSWAWAFLSRAVAADQLLPEPVIFAPFDATRLLDWFKELGTTEWRFRRSQSGHDVLEAGEDGQPKDDFLRILAGRSLGIPWIAWHMWRRSLRTKADDSPAEDLGAVVAEGETPSQQTLWVAALEDLLLPGKHEQSALLVLHALLIHGPLDAAHLRLVLPIVGESNIVSVLVGAGFVERAGDAFSVRPAAYPAIRAGLDRAGLPLDRI